MCTDCELEDTFISWFTVVELHLWLLGARIMQEGADGRVVRNSMFQALWEDCDLKSKKLDGALASARKRQILELGDQFQATLVSYDEGLLGNDVVLAGMQKYAYISPGIFLRDGIILQYMLTGALWRRFLQRKKNMQRCPEELLRDSLALEMLVIYVRSQYYNLNEVGKLQLLRRKFEWTEFDESLLRLVDNNVGQKKIINKSV